MLTASEIYKPKGIQFEKFDINEEGSETRRNSVNILEKNFKKYNMSKFNWFIAKDTPSYFFYKTNFTYFDKKKYEIFFDYESYSDGLEYRTIIFIFNTGDDPFNKLNFIDSKSIKEKLLNESFKISRNDYEFFKLKIYDYKIPQTKNLSNEYLKLPKPKFILYGISLGGEIKYLLDSNSQEIKELNQLLK